MGPRGRCILRTPHLFDDTRQRFPPIAFIPSSFGPSTLFTYPFHLHCTIRLRYTLGRPEMIIIYNDRDKTLDYGHEDRIFSFSSILKQNFIPFLFLTV
jgi:hypothetical protein